MDKAAEMVESQIRAQGVKDERVLNAMKKVKRHLFVPEDERAYAYEDTPLPIAQEQTISQPYIVGLMTELMGLKGNEKVLEIGTGSGYQAAILAELCGEVYSVEINPVLAKQAATRLEGLGYKNIHISNADGGLGWEKHAPYDAIIAACAAEKVPRAFIDQVKEGGRIVMPLGTFYQELFLMTKKHGEIITQDIIPVRFVPMVGTWAGA